MMAWHVRIGWIHFAIFSLCWMGNDGLAQRLNSNTKNRSEILLHGDGSAIIVDVDHGRTRHRFLVDTGSKRTVLHTPAFRTVLQSVRLPERDSAYSGFKNPGDLVLSQSQPIRVDPLYGTTLSRFSAAIGEEIHGVLGCDFLNQYVIEADVDLGRLRLDTVSTRTQGVCIELTRDEMGRPTLKVPLREFGPNSPQAEFLIDSAAVGVGGLVLRKELFNEYIKHGVLSVEGTSTVAHASRYVTTRSGSLRRFTLGSTFEDIQVDERVGTQINLLGLSYLMQFNFTLDLPNSKLYLRPRKTPSNLLQLKDLSGMGFLRETSDITVKRVEPQSPAAQCDIRLGDVITSVDGVAAEKLRLHPLRVTLCEAGKVVRVGMRRASKTWTVNLKLADWRKPATKSDFE